VIGCNRPGHSCPSSWSDGYTGWTYFYGTWSPKTGGVTLVPTDDNTGMTSPPIDLALQRTGTSLAVTGSIGTLQLKGPMTARALLNGSHTVKDAQLDGTWKFTADNRSGGSANNIEGYSEAVNGQTHTVFFDAATSEAREVSPNKNVHDHGYIFQVAGDPSGGSLGVVYFRNGTEFAALKIKSKTSTSMVLRSDEDSFDFKLTKQ
jgi:hypothetical protein